MEVKAQGAIEMAHNTLVSAIRPWLEEELGTTIESAAVDPIPVLATEGRRSISLPFWAVKLDGVAIVTARSDWVDPLRSVVERLTLDELFSVFGAYELARVTLPEGISIFGPSWYFVANDTSFRPVNDPRPVQLSSTELADTVDFQIFWHCFPKEAFIGFGIFENAELTALATARQRGELMWEIGVDVAPEAKTRGLGRAVVSAVGCWILEQKRLVLASSAPWNVPSVRTLRSLGLQMVLSDMQAKPGPLLVPPQPLGTPYPGAEAYNHYPDWAMNKAIRPARR